MKNKLGTEKRELEYYKPDNLIRSIKRSAKQHGFNGFFGVLYYTIKKNIDWLFSIIAYFAPFTGIRIFFHRLKGVKIGKRAFIGYQCVLDEVFPDFIEIGNDVSLAGGVWVLTHSTPYMHHSEMLKSFVAPVKIKDKAWITINVTILPGVTIGEGSIITAGSVVNRDIPDWVIAGGNPAKVIKKLK
ncbi:MAG: acyltransferase [Candidatus Kapabacteria bacterium]|nr:acyltransferase [Candidatus Kapabacteria bacterium]